MEIKIDESNLVQVAEKVGSAKLIWSNLVIDSTESFRLAGADLRELKLSAKKIEEEEESFLGPLKVAVKNIKDKFKVHHDALDEGIKIVQSKMAEWTAKENALIEWARREAEEATRIAREEQVKAAREAAEAAIKARESGDAATASRLIAQSTEADLMAKVFVATPVFTETTKVEGLNTRTTWGAELFDIIELAKAVVEGSAPAEALMVNQPFVNSQARAFKKEGLLYPGVKIVATTSQVLAR